MKSLGRQAARLKELRRRVRSRQPGELLVDGRRLVADLVRWGVPIRELYLAAGIELEPEVVDAAEAAWSMAPELIAAVAPTRSPQGVLAVVEEPRWEPWPAASGVGLYVERVQDPGNLGALVRCAAALGCDAVLLSPTCVDPFGWAAVRASAGAVLRMPVAREVVLSAVARRVRSNGGEVWAAATAGEQMATWRPRRPLLLVVGAEGVGVSDASIALANGQVSIPLERGIDSLNVAVAAGILLHHLRVSS